MTTDVTQGLRARTLLLLLSLVLFGLNACGTYEDKRIREMMVEKGFGTRAQGNATRENYIGGRDGVAFLLPPEPELLLVYPRLAELGVPQPVGIDGTIHVPYVGPVYVLGLTEAELTALVKSLLRASGVTTEIDLEARIAQGGKVFYAIGETGLKGPLVMSADLTLFDAMFQCGWSPLANLGRVYLIRPDAEHPLVVDINFREMMLSGYMKSNFEIRERDIIYVPPTFLGLIARLLQRMFEPIGLAVRTLLGAAQIQASYEVLTGQRDQVFFRY